MYKEAEQISAEVLEASPDDESALANQKAARNSLLHRSNSAGGGGAARPPEVYFFLLVPPSLAYLHLQPPPQDFSYFSSLSTFCEMRCHSSKLTQIAACHLTEKAGESAEQGEGSAFIHRG